MDLQAATLCTSGEEAESLGTSFQKEGAPALEPRELPSVLTGEQHILLPPFCEGNPRPTVGQFDPAPILNKTGHALTERLPRLAGKCHLPRTDVSRPLLV